MQNRVNEGIQMNSKEELEPLNKNLRRLMSLSKLKGVTHLVSEIERSLAESGQKSPYSKPPSQPVIHRIWSGETTNPKIETVRPIAKYFGVSLSALVGDEPLPDNYIPGSYNGSISSYQRVPLLKWEQINSLPELPEVNTHARIPTILTDVNVGGKGYAVTIEESTVAPYFRLGTVLVMNYELKPRNGDFVIAQIKDEPLIHFKQLLIDGHHAYLKPFNSEFKIIPLEKEYRILGVLVQTQWKPLEENRKSA